MLRLLLTVIVLVQANELGRTNFCFQHAGLRFCLNVLKENKTFLAASDACRGLGKELLTISDKTEQRFTLRVLNRTFGPDVHFWFGFHTYFDRYRWASGDPVVNTFLSTSNTSDYRSCFSIQAGYSLYTWTPEYCNTKLWFLCAPRRPRRTATSAPTIEHRGCPDDFVKVGDRCFHSRLETNDTRSWSDASTFCSNLTAGGSLATVPSLLEQDYIAVSSSQSHRPVWIGMQLYKGEHHWVNGDNVTFTNWMPLQPASSRGERCTSMQVTPNHFGEWQDVNCNTNLGFVCQAPLLASGGNNTSGLSRILLDKKTCRTGFFEYRKRCYRLVLKSSAQTPAGLASLKGDDCPSRLAPHSNEEVAMMRLFLNAATQPVHNLAWIGVSFSRAQDHRLDFQVEDGLPVPFLSSSDYSSLTHPQNKTTSEHRCLALTRVNVGLVWMKCTAALPSICGYSLPGYDLDSTNKITCPLNWHAFGKKCYSDINYPALTWIGAELACKALHGESHIVSVHNPAEHHFVSGLVSHQRAWLGLRLQPKSFDGGQHFEWSDASPVDYLPFAIGQPSMELNNGEVEECVMLQAGSQDWNDVSCYDRHPYVCQLSLSNQAKGTSVPIVTPPVISDILCSGSELNPSLCVELHLKPATLWIAEQECRSRGKTLLTIPNKEHQHFVMEWLRKLYTGSSIKVFIGLFSSRGRWLWASGYQALPATFWTAGHPSGNQSCVYIDTATGGLFTWTTGSCDEPLPYICSNPLPVVKPHQLDFTLYTCPSNYTRIGSSCFMVKADQSTQVTWKEAAKFCQKTATNASLATVTDLHNHDGLATLLALQSQSAWIGLHLVDGVHFWLRGDPVTYTNWDAGEPAIYGTRCTAMGHRYNNMGDWIDVECDTRMGFICQADPVKSTNPQLIPELEGLFQTGRCSAGFYEYRNQCFALAMHSLTHQRSSVDLRDPVSGGCVAMSRTTGANCGTATAHWGSIMCPVVATPHTHADAAFLRVLLSRFGMDVKMAWVGVKVHLLNNTFTLVSEDESLLGTSSLMTFDSPVLQAAWSSGNPYSCVAISTLDTNLVHTRCSSDLPVACGYYLADHPLHHSRRFDHTERCPPGWTAFDSRCYWSPPPETRLNWTDAELFCQSAARAIPSTVQFSGHLASVHTFEEQHLVSELARATSFWLGLWSTVDSEHLTTKADKYSRHLYWTDQSPVDYLPLLPSELNVTGNLRSCFSIQGRDSYLQQTECHQVRNFVCQLTPPDLYELSLNENSQSTVQCDQTFPMLSTSRRACYRIIESTVDWAGAESVCRNLEKGAHLASVHSHQELMDLIELLPARVKPMSRTWLGLFESELAYAWSDGSPVDFIPASADTSKDKRHLLEDCFALIPTSTDAGGYVVKLQSASCTEKLDAFVCQRGSTTTSQPAPDPSTWKPVLCPPGYRQYANRCFAVYPSVNTREEANRICSQNAAEFRSYSGSLARIDSVFVQDFVSSMLDDLPERMNSAWIGLQRDASETAPNLRWPDGRPVNFLRPVYRSRMVSAFNESSAGIDLSQPAIKMCTAMYRSTHPRLNGLWLQWSCTEQLQLPAICQAVPPDGMNVDSETARQPSPGCPAEFILSTTGFASDPSRRISHPVCYRLLSVTEKVDWKTANNLCKSLSTKDFQVHLLSVASVFEANFLRSWLRLPRSMGGAGLTADEPVWSGLNINVEPTAQFSNWTWDTQTREPVRYTDWIFPPRPTTSGCYLFYSNPYVLSDSMVDKNLGSLQPAQSCALNYFAVCQTVTKSDHTDVFPSHQVRRPLCEPDTMLLQQSTSRSGKTCIRWDLVPRNLTNFQEQLNSPHHELRAADIVGGQQTSSYAENFCSSVYNATIGHWEYGCYVQADPAVFELCRPTKCALSTASHGIHGGLVFILVVLVLLFILGALYISWRYSAPLRAGYSRYFSSSSTHSKRRMTVHFYRPSATESSPTKLPSGSVVGASNGVKNSYPTDVPVGSMGFVNPFYTSTAVPVFEDEFDPELEI